MTPDRTPASQEDTATAMVAVIGMEWGRRVEVAVSVMDQPIFQDQPPPPRRLPTPDEWPAILAALVKMDFESLRLITPDPNEN